MADTRKDKRAPVSLKVRFKSATVDEFIEHYCKDVSRGGIFIKSSQPMPIGTLLKFQFQLKDESQLIRGVGRVVWTRSEERAGPERPSGMGIKFIKMDNESRVMVERIITASEGTPGAYEDGRGPNGSIDSDVPPAPAQETNTAESGFFPDLGPAELPPPEDRTAVREAAEFLAAALSEVNDEAAAREAEQKAQEARKRTAEIEAQRVAAAEQQRKGSEALPSMIIDPVLSVPPPAAGPAVPPAVVISPPATPPVRPAPPTPAAAVSAAAHSVSNSSLPPPASAAAHAARVASPPPPSPEPAPKPVVVPPAAALPTVPLHADDPSASQERAKKSPVLPVLAIAAVLAVAAFVALRGGPDAGESQASAIDAPQVGKPSVQAEPEPLAAEPAAEPAAAAIEPEVAPEAEPEPVELVQIRVSSAPAGAEIVIDGKSQGNAPLALDLPKDVAVVIEARLAAHGTAREEFTPSANKPLKLSLKALPFVLHVETTPPGAAVNVSGKRGTSPVDLTWSTAPKAALKAVAKLAGHSAAELPVAVDAFEQGEEAMQASIELTLEALPEKVVAAPKPRTTSAKSAAPAAGSASDTEDDPGAAPKPEEPKAEPAAPKPEEPKAEPKPEEPKSEPKPAEPKSAEPLPDNPFG